MSQTTIDYVERYAHMRARILKLTIKLVESNQTEFGRGVDEKDVAKHFPREYGFEAEQYENRLRGCVNYDKTMGRHRVPYKGKLKRKFFPLCLDKKGLIDHSKCVNCERVGVEENTQP